VDLLEVMAREERYVAMLSSYISLQVATNLFLQLLSFCRYFLFDCMVTSIVEFENLKKVKKRIAHVA